MEGCIYEIKKGPDGAAQVPLELKQNTFHKKMANYFSIGVDARIGFGFDKLRTTSRCCNKCVYCWEGFKKLFLKTAKVRDAIENVELLDNDSSQQLLFKTNGRRDSHTISGDPVTLICLNINSYSGGV